jgi:AcrR family transcriptional regulator
MPSQIATKPSAAAREPKRQRGRLRVAAILQAGREVFMEKGYDAATMTEIAARSGTAIGSLYRFFPSKESLADALLQDYAEQMVEGLSKLTGQVSHSTPAGTTPANAANATPEGAVANSLVDLMLTLQEERSVALVLIDARNGSADLKVRYRKAMRQGVAQILKKLAPHLPRARAEAMAAVVVHVLKAVARTTEEEDPATSRSVLAEIRGLIRLYLNTVN